MFQAPASGSHDANRLGDVHRNQARSERSKESARVSHISSLSQPTPHCSERPSTNSHHEHDHASRLTAAGNALRAPYASRCRFRSPVNPRKSTPAADRAVIAAPPPGRCDLCHRRQVRTAGAAAGSPASEPGRREEVRPEELDALHRADRRWSANDDLWSVSSRLLTTS